MDAVTEEEKLVAAGYMHKHLLCAQKERDLYLELLHILVVCFLSHLLPSDCRVTAEALLAETT